jgi:hypothetical protein
MDEVVIETFSAKGGRGILVNGTRSHLEAVVEEGMFYDANGRREIRHRVLLGGVEVQAQVFRDGVLVFTSDWPNPVRTRTGRLEE